MRYKVYTDGAVDEEKRIISCSYIIIARRQFIHMDSCVHKGKTSLLSEVAAIDHAIEYILKNISFTSEDIVEFYVDNMRAIDLLVDFDASEEFTKTHRLARMTHTGLLLLEKKCPYKFIWMSSHARSIKEVNGNKVADRLCKLALFIAQNEDDNVCML